MYEEFLEKTFAKYAELNWHWEGRGRIKKKPGYDFARYSGPDKVHVPIPFPEKNYSVPWHFSSKFILVLRLF